MASLLLVKILTDDVEHEAVFSMCLLVSLLIACVVLGHHLEETWWMNESVTALLLGLFAGVIVSISSEGQSSHVLKLDEELFFVYLLPPTVFNAGFSAKKEQFFENFIAIMLFGVVGVIISFAIISTGTWWLFPKLGLDSLPIRDILAIGVIFSATDSVCTLQVLNQDETPLLYSLVFGEGLVNGATSVVLFRTVQTYNFDNFTLLEGFRIGGSFLYLFFLSCVLGASLGQQFDLILFLGYRDSCISFLRSYGFPGRFGLWDFMSSCNTKTIGRHSTRREITIIIMIVYLYYYMAEVRHLFSTISFIAESFSFLYVGMYALDIDKWRMTQSSFLESLGLFGSLMGLILLGRAAFVFPLSILSNYTSKSAGSKIGVRQMIITWWAGLMRGAVSIALAFNQFTMDGNKSKTGQHASLITTTFTVVLVSTIVFGIERHLLLPGCTHPTYLLKHPLMVIIIS